MISKAIRDLYNWTLRLAGHKNATGSLAAVSFVESSFFPLPPDIVLIPMCVARRDRAFYYAFICTISSVLGGIFGYAIGYFLYETLGKAILDFYSAAPQFEVFRQKYNEWGGWIVFGAGLTPFPYKVVTIASGSVQMNLALFTVASVIGRAARFYLVAALIWKYGAPIQQFIEKYLGILTLIFFVLLIGGFIAIKYVV